MTNELKEKLQILIQEYDIQDTDNPKEMTCNRRMALDLIHYKELVETLIKEPKVTQMMYPIKSNEAKLIYEGYSYWKKDIDSEIKTNESDKLIKSIMLRSIPCEKNDLQKNEKSEESLKIEKK